MGKSAQNLPPVPSHFVKGVTDPNLRALLQAVVDGWNQRNGIRGGTKDTEFITVADINSDPELRRRLRLALGI